MSDLVKFRIPASFVLDRLVPTAGEIVYGFRHGWLQAQDVFAISLTKLERRLSMTHGEKQVALLSGDDDLYEVAELVTELEKSDISLRDTKTVWLFLALDWIHAHRSEFEDPLQMIEMLYADFEYPAEIECLVRFMPAPIGTPVGPTAIEDRWRLYLETKREYYRTR